jgi:hypothetical protein
MYCLIWNICVAGGHMIVISERFRTIDSLIAIDSHVLQSFCVYSYSLCPAPRHSSPCLAPWPAPTPSCCSLPHPSHWVPVPRHVEYHKQYNVPVGGQELHDDVHTSSGSCKLIMHSLYISSGTGESHNSRSQSFRSEASMYGLLTPSNV